MVTETEIGIETTLKFKLLSFSLLFLIPSSSSQPFAVCDNETSFVTDTKYHTNLNTVFHSLSSNATAPASNLFFSTSAGATTSDSVFGLFICRGDVNASSCHDCVSTATTTDLPITYCANRKVAIIWYDACMVRYSDQALLGKLALDPEEVAFDGPSVDANSTQLNLLLAKTMDELTSEVAAGDKSGKKFAVRETNLTESEDLYVLAQCTPDLSSGDCKECLKVASQRLFVKKEGAVVFLPSCMVQYETYYPPIPSNSSGNGGTGIKSDVGKKKVSAKEVVIIVASVIFVLLGLILTAVYVIKKKAKKQDLLLFGSGGDFATVESLQYDLATLQSATNNFSDENKLGQGGFGTVYKGRLSNGQEIAVKRLSTTSGQGVQEFKNEVLLVAKLQHRNLVRLLGFCISGQEKLLVYEFVSNGSLDYLLFDPEKQGQLDWAKRYDIIRGVARGMLYLHQESRMKIIHRDLKASNVLLDTDMNPKISDFGVARIFGVDQTQGNTNKVVGTYGYMAPEYALHGRFSVKSDVYSFGVLVLEIVSGKKNSSFYESGYADGLLSYAWKQWREETVLEFVDPKIRESCLNNEVMRCIHLSLLCVQESMHERPTMAKVVLKLDSHALSLPSPHQPAFFFINHENESTGFTRYAGSDQWASRSFPVSVNDASISEMEPR